MNHEELTEDVLVVVELVRRHRAVHGHGHALLHDLLLEAVDLLFVFLPLLLECLMSFFLVFSPLLLYLLQLLGHLGLQVDPLLGHQLLMGEIPIDPLVLDHLLRRGGHQVRPRRDAPGSTPVSGLGLFGMVKPEDVILAQDHPGPGLEHGRAVQLPAVDEADRAGLGDELDDAVGSVLEGAVLGQDVGADELDVLGDVGIRRSDLGHALLDVVQEALGQRGVLVQVDQMRCLECHS